MQSPLHTQELNEIKKTDKAAKYAIDMTGMTTTRLLTT